MLNTRASDAPETVQAVQAEGEATVRKLDLTGFEKLVNFAKDNGRDMPIPCGDQEQAEFMLDKLFDSTNTRVNIVLGDFPPKFLEYLHEDIFKQEFLSKKICTRIIVMGNRAIPPMLASIVSQNKGLFEIAINNSSSDSVIKNAKISPDGPGLVKDNNVLTFLTFDDNKYMLQKIPRDFYSFSNFNGKDLNATLNKVFEEAWRRITIK